MPFPNFIYIYIYIYSYKLPVKHLPKSVRSLHSVYGTVSCSASHLLGVTGLRHPDVKRGDCRKQPSPSINLLHDRRCLMERLRFCLLPLGVLLKMRPERCWRDEWTYRDGLFCPPPPTTKESGGDWMLGGGACWPPRGLVLCRWKSSTLGQWGRGGGLCISAPINLGTL